MSQGTDLFNSSKGQFLDYTTLIGGKAPNTENWFVDDFLTKSNISEIGASGSFGISEGLIVTNPALTNLYSFSSDQKSSLKNAAIVLDYVTGESVLDFQIGVFARKASSSKYLSAVVENSVYPNLKIIKTDTTGSPSDTVLETKSIPVALRPNTRYWLVLICVDNIIRCEHWDSDPRVGTNFVAAAEHILTGSNASTFNVSSKIGVTKWRPVNRKSTIKKIECGRAFTNNETIMSTVLAQKHVDIRDFVNYKYPVRYRTIKELNTYHTTENALSQTITLLDTPTGGSFNLLYYPKDNDPYAPVTIGPFSIRKNVAGGGTVLKTQTELQTEIKNSLNTALNPLPRFSTYIGDPIKNVRSTLDEAKPQLLIEFNEYYGDISLLRMTLASIVPPTLSDEEYDSDLKIGTFAPNALDEYYLETADPIDPTFTVDDMREAYRIKSENWKLYKSGLTAPSTRDFQEKSDLIVGKLKSEGNRRGLLLNFSRAMNKKNKTSKWDVFLQSSTTTVNALTIYKPLNAIAPVQSATVAALSNSPTYTDGSIKATIFGRLIVDGRNVTTGERVLVKNQTDAKQNGIYDVTFQGSNSGYYVLTRSLDYNSSSRKKATAGDYVFVLSGNTQNGKTFIMKSLGSSFDKSISFGLDEIIWDSGDLSINMTFAGFPWDPITKSSVIDLSSSGCYIQFTSQKNGLFADQGGSSTYDSNVVYFKDHLYSSTASSPNVEFKALVSEFITVNPQFSFSSITGVRIYIKESIASTISELKILSIRCIDNSISGGKKWLSAEINTLEQSLSAPALDYTQEEIPIPPMIGGKYLETIQSDISPIDSRQSIIFQTGIGKPKTVPPTPLPLNRMMIFAREQEFDDLQKSSWLTAEYTYNTQDSSILLYKTLRVCSSGSQDLFWDIHPGGIYKTVYNVIEYPVTHCTQTTRPGYQQGSTPPSIGDYIYQEDTGEFFKWDGISWALTRDPNESTIGQLDLPEPEGHYEIAAIFRSNSISFELIKLTSAEQPALTLYSSDFISSEEWESSAGRIGWYVEFADKDLYISSFDLDSAAYALLRTKAFLSETPVEGAQLFTVDSGHRNLFESFMPFNSSDFVSIDHQKTTSQLGSYVFKSSGQTANPGIISNEFTVIDWNHIYIEFDIWVPRRMKTAALRPKLLLLPSEQPEGTSGIDIFSGIVPSYAPIAFDFIPGAWSKFFLDLRGISAKMGNYRLVLVSDGDGNPDDSIHADKWWIDNIQINSQTIEWEMRAVKDGPWTPFRRNINKQYGALHLADNLVGKNFQLQARALTEDAWVAEYTAIPKYISPGRVISLNTTRTTDPTGSTGPIPRPRPKTVGGGPGDDIFTSNAMGTSISINAEVVIGSGRVSAQQLSLREVISGSANVVGNMNEFILTKTIIVSSDYYLPRRAYALQQSGKVESVASVSAIETGNKIQFIDNKTVSGVAVITFTAKA